MKKFFKKVGAFLRQTWVWTLLLVLFVALLVWFVGPLLAVDDYKFWESPTSRLLTIAALFLIWGLYHGLRQLARRCTQESSRGTAEDGQDRIRRDRADRRGTERVEGAFQGRAENPEDLEPVSWPQRALAQRTAVVSADRPAGQRQDQPAGLLRSGVPDQQGRPQADP